MDTPEATVIAEIPKNRLDAYVVRIGEYKGHQFVDVRLWTESGSGPEKIPTRKGVAIKPDCLRDVIAALERAADEVAP